MVSSASLFSAEVSQGFADVVIAASSAAVPVLDPERSDHFIQAKRERAREVTAEQYAKLAQAMQLETRRLVAQWGRDFDVLLTPTMACPTPEVGTVYDEANANPLGFRETEVRQVPFTAFCNMAGLPAISLPVHTAAGLPVGAQLVGGPFGEALLLKLAAQMEEAFAWQERASPYAADR